MTSIANMRIPKEKKKPTEMTRFVANIAENIKKMN